MSDDLLNCTKAISRVYKYYEFLKLGKKRVPRANPDPSTRHNEFNNNFQSTTLASATSSYRISIESCVHQATKNSEGKKFSQTEGSKNSQPKRERLEID